MNRTEHAKGQPPIELFARIEPVSVDEDFVELMQESVLELCRVDEVRREDRSLSWRARRYLLVIAASVGLALLGGAATLVVRGFPGPSPSQQASLGEEALALYPVPIETLAPENVQSETIVEFLEALPLVEELDEEGTQVVFQSAQSDLNLVVALYGGAPGGP